MQPDPEPGQPARIRNAGNSDQDNRHREQLRQDPLPEISSQDNRHGSGTLVAVIRTTGTGSSCGRILCPTGNQCSRIRSQARVISSGICQLMVCSRILCRIRSQDNRHGSGTLVAVIRTPAAMQPDPGAAGYSW